MQLVQLVGVALKEAIRRESESGGTFAYFPFFVRGRQSGTWWIISVRGDSIGRHRHVLKKIEPGLKLFILGDLLPPSEKDKAGRLTARAFRIRILDGREDKLSTDNFIFEDDNCDPEYKGNMQ